jgi:peptide deformylase
MVKPKPALERTAAHVPRSGTYAKAQAAKVLAYPDPLLAAPARVVDPLDPAVVALGELLVATMRASPACVGLAATQIGERAHVFCMDVASHPKTRSCAGLVVLANARVLAVSRAIVMREGCMSVPALTGNVLRSAEVTVEGVEPGSGRIIRIDADAMEARCLQHELDHLDGFLFVDRVRDPGEDLFTRKRYA